MHARSSLFSLIGRRVVIGPRQGTIVDKVPGRMVFDVRVDGEIISCHRCEFKLPPLPRHTRAPVWLPDDYNGFVYEGVEGF
jgi:hypothetical protein